MRPETKSTVLPLGTVTTRAQLTAAQPSMGSADRRCLLWPAWLGESILRERGDLEYMNEVWRRGYSGWWTGGKARARGHSGQWPGARPRSADLAAVAGGRDGDAGKRMAACQHRRCGLDKRKKRIDTQERTAVFGGCSGEHVSP